MDWYERVLVATGRAAAVWSLVGFLVTFVIVRGITRRIRAQKNADGDGDGVGVGDEPAVDTGAVAVAVAETKRRGFSDVYIGGVHVHHQVWGIVLVLVSGMLEFRYSPQSPWLEILAALFGIGAALILDEFALLFYLSDVYWGEDGRKSIDAILIGAALGIVLLTQASPFGTADGDAAGVYVAVVVLHVTTAALCIAKGKLATGVIGVVIPVVALIGMIRLAKPESPWARRRYASRPRKLARSHRRFGTRYERRRDRILDAIGGRPNETDDGTD